MTQMKIGGVVITGVAAFLLINKGLNLIRGSVNDISDAIKWRAYYKCKRENPIAPHYERRVEANNIAKDDGGNPPKNDISDATAERFGKTLAGAITKTIDNLFEAGEGAKTADKEALKPITYNTFKEFKTDEISDYDPQVADRMIFITEEQFLNEHSEYNKCSIVWYKNDNTAVDTSVYTVCNWLDIQKLLDKAGKEAEDFNEKVIYIRNDAWAADYEVIIHDGAYVADAWETPIQTKED